MSSSSRIHNQSSHGIKYASSPQTAEMFSKAVISVHVIDKQTPGKSVSNRPAISDVLFLLY